MQKTERKKGALKMEGSQITHNYCITYSYTVKKKSEQKCRKMSGICFYGQTSFFLASVCLGNSCLPDICTEKSGE